MEFDVAAGWPKTTQAKAGDDPVTELLCNHTLLIGQSRSGKTNAARRIVEEVVRSTNGRVVILDPNADFREITALDDKVEQLRTVSVPLDDNHRKAIAEANAFASAWEALRPSMKVVRPDSDQGARLWRLGRRNPNSRQIDRHVRDQANRLVVVDLSADGTRHSLAATTLTSIWDAGQVQRAEYNLKGAHTVHWSGTLVVVDEAHLFAPRADLVVGGGARRGVDQVSERIQRISDQGKKLNLYLLLVTQQPSKLHERILAECDNRLVLRMNDRLSLKILETTYGGQAGRYDGALTFEKGWALAEGAFLCDAVPPDSRPRGIKFRLGRTKAGGGSADKRWVKPT